MTFRKNKRTLVASIITTLALSATLSCSNANSTKQDAQQITDSANTEQTGAVVEKKGITFKNTANEVIALDDLKGKVVFINFWATWCPPCIHEMPSIQELRQSFADNEDIVFIMVDVDGDIKVAQDFMDKRKFDLPVFVPHSDIPETYLGGAIPTTVILDRKGEMAVRLEGGRDYAAPEIKKGISELLAEEA